MRTRYGLRDRKIVREMSRCRDGGGEKGGGGGGGRNEGDCDSLSSGTLLFFKH